MDDGKTYGLKSTDVRRLKETNRYHEKTYRNRRPREPRGVQPGYQGLIPAKATSGIAAGTIASPASATVTMMIPSGTGMTTTGGDTVTCLNPYTGSVPSGALIWVTGWNNNIYVVAANCS